MTMLEGPKWQEKDRESVEFESEAYGCKLSSKNYRTDMALLVDVV